MSTLRDLHPNPSIQAHLGPTNTGKTHRAVQRMLGRRTGMIGLPLRLLAREVYDRVVARVGAGAVALVTGEEKLVPAQPRYWVCTVESMPVSRTVEFLAVDEIQLCAHRGRGHVFTDRLLHARGTHDTWFMGSDTMVPAIEALVPTAELHRHPRLSRLRYAGATPLSDLPPRSVVVAFSVAQVYAVAERLRRRRGGAAVVLGALSPRARNAQVAMYQAGEVQYMVATDAIGMGLNMDVEHVAFADVCKFDGHARRDLTTAELAQIAGRAGRYKSDGTFGTLEDVGPLDPRVVADIEAHRFEPVQRLVWRNSALDFGTIDTLLQGLRARPRGRWFTAVDHTDDADALERLAQRDDVRALAQDAGAVELLWEVCRVPDFRKLLEDSHIRLLADVYGQLAGPRGALDPDWLGARLDRLDRTDGDIDTLTTRLAFMRTWTYITNRRGWLDAPEGWQQRAREIEDRLSDALHERLASRFVDGRTGLVAPRRAPVGAGEAGTVAPGRAPDPDSPFAALGGLAVRPDPRVEAVVPVGPSPVQRAASEARVARLLAAPDAEISLSGDLDVRFEEGLIGRIGHGPELLRPQVGLRGLPGLDARGRRTAQARLATWLQDQVALLLAPLHRKPALSLSPAGRGVVYLLEAGLGMVSVADARVPLRDLAPSDHRPLARLGIRRGAREVYATDLLKPDAVRWRAVLWQAYHNAAAAPVPAGGAASVRMQPGLPQGYYRAIGYVPAGAHALRVDQLERALAFLRKKAAAGPFPPPEELLSWLGLPRADLVPTIVALGGELLPDGRFAGAPRGRRREPRAW